jgi:starch synthase (maltosyl-transferring)
MVGRRQSGGLSQDTKRRGRPPGRSLRFVVRGQAVPRRVTTPAAVYPVSVSHASAADPGFGRPGGLVPPATVSGRFPVTDVWPTVQAGRRPAKAAVGEQVTIEATCYREGHDSLGVHVLVQDPEGGIAGRFPMRPSEPGLNRWSCDAWRPDRMGDWTFAIEAFHDPLDTWRRRAEVKIPAGVDVMLELAEGAALFRRAADHLEAHPDPLLDLGESAAHAAELLRESASALLDDRRPAGARLAVALAPDIMEFLSRGILRDYANSCGPWPVRVDRRRALFSAWYEFFPRSEGASEGVSGTFATAADRLPAVAGMGFDIIYLPPIHPIGTTNRKGRNNALQAGPDDPGSPWAIGAAAGGHDALHPDLGTWDDFAAFLARAADLGLEVAVDLALQASPDHPWVREHPEWFTTRADGTIAYAENPPKKYQDIYPLNFDNDPEGLYAEVERVTRSWVERGVRIFRVDNPHTKPLWVWDRLIGSINASHPDVLFLAEAFTLPAMMQGLAEVGFQQSYSYFTWRNDPWSLAEYAAHLAGSASAYMRPNFWPNTPDILPEVLQHGGPPAFAMRATLAATLSPCWGIYSGYELFENIPLAPGKEEYRDSEKYQLRPRDWVSAAEQPNLVDHLTLLNQVRQRHPALQQLRSLAFHRAEDDAVIAYSKRDGTDTVIVICNMDPHQVRETTVWLDMPSLGAAWDATLAVQEEITGERWRWGQAVYVRLEPGAAHIAAVEAGAD